MSICTCTPKQKRSGKHSVYCKAHPGFIQAKPRRQKPQTDHSASVECPTIPLTPAERMKVAEGVVHALTRAGKALLKTLRKDQIIVDSHPAHALAVADVSRLRFQIECAEVWLTRDEKMTYLARSPRTGKQNQKP